MDVGEEEGFGGGSLGGGRDGGKREEGKGCSGWKGLGLRFTLGRWHPNEHVRSPGPRRCPRLVYDAPLALRVRSARRVRQGLR